MRHLTRTLGLAALLLFLPAWAHAETYLSALAGVSFGGSAPTSRPIVGAGITFSNASAGLELEYATASGFAGAGSASRVSTFMASIVGGSNVRGMGVKPFLVAGAGLIPTTTGSTA